MLTTNCVEHVKQIHVDPQEGLHVFVFCAAEYQHIIKECIDSIEQCITDNIVSRNIISNITIDVDGYTLIKDADFWKLLDPTFQYRNLYNHNWLKQQIFKLNLDKLASGNVLVVDAEVRFQKPTRWVFDDCYNVFYGKPWVEHSSETFIKQIANIEVDLNKSFITEAMVFSTDTLAKIHAHIESLHNLPFLSAIQRTVFSDPNSIKPELKMFVSEYDLYANFLIKFYPQHTYQLIPLMQSSNFYSIKTDITSNSLKNQTKWITFYQQIKDPAWPDCDSEDNFYNLPKHVQKECIEIFGYVPVNLDGH